MILTILDILGGVFINLGILILNINQDISPKTKIRANLCIIFGCSSLAILFAISTSYIFSVSVQLGVIASSTYGIFLCRRELKLKKQTIDKD